MSNLYGRKYVSNDFKMRQVYEGTHTRMPTEALLNNDIPRNILNVQKYDILEYIIANNYNGIFYNQ